MDIAQLYRDRYENYLLAMANRIEEFLTEILSDVPNIDRVSARAKSPGSFIEKASRQEDGVSKYAHPLEEILDQLGARVTVLYLGDVQVIAERLSKYLSMIENVEMMPDSDWKFGYFGRHMMAPIPQDVLLPGYEDDGAPSLFEIQVKTVFQHAWSEANHDLGYKPAAAVSDEQARWLAFAASQAWGADRALEQLRAEVGLASDEPPVE